VWCAVRFASSETKRNGGENLFVLHQSETLKPKRNGSEAEAKQTKTSEKYRKRKWKKHK